MILVDVFSASLVQRAPYGRTAAMCACEAQEELLAEWLISEGTPEGLWGMDGEKLEVFIHFLKRGIVRETLQQIDGMNFRKSQFEPYNRLININDLICIVHACYHHLLVRLDFSLWTARSSKGLSSSGSKWRWWIMDYKKRKATFVRILHLGASGWFLS